MPQREHKSVCMLPDCEARIPFQRLLRNRWYCAEKHWVADTDRRSRLTILALAMECPSRCIRENCLSPIPRWRRLRKLDYCSEYCRRDEFRSTDKSEPLRRALLVVGFGGVVTAIAKYALDSKPVKGDPRPRPTVGEVHTHKTNITTWQGPELKNWTCKTRPNATADWIEPLGPALYNVIPKASSGLLVVKSSLAEVGSADFLLGTDSEVQNAFVLTLKSTILSVELSVASVLEGKFTQLAGGITVPRQNQILHDIAIKFDGDSIHATFRDTSQHWSHLRVAPGLVGFRGFANSQFRVYNAQIELES